MKVLSSSKIKASRFIWTRYSLLWAIWVFAVLVRVGFLIALPILSQSITCGGYAQQFVPPIPKSAGIFKILDNRIYILPLTEDEHRYHEMAENILKGKGICVNYDWFTLKGWLPNSSRCFFISSIFISNLCSVPPSSDSSVDCANTSKLGYYIPYFLLNEAII